MNKIIAILFAVFVGGAAMTAVAPTPVFAANCEFTFLGLRPWYHGLLDPTTCEVIIPQDPPLAGHKTIPEFVWTIILNIAIDLFIAAGVVALGFIIYGGFRYIMSNGDPGKVASAKKTLSAAIIGLIITMLATVISNTIIELFLNARTPDSSAPTSNVTINLSDGVKG